MARPGRLHVCCSFRAPVARWGSHGREAGRFDWGHDIAVDSRGQVYVVDIRGHRVRKFRPVK
ncbi:hypothetical protein [Myxococcus stipitatus]|uniref:hypothetical protein n=1 Tax=Myxococcus stipitatus TaxID=83455 RepID=UPI0002FD35CB|nr:hypothetical protein [Myxococcus stipitatus]